MKFSDPSEFFKYLNEQFGLSIFKNYERCLSFVEELLECDKRNIFFINAAFIKKVYETLIKANNSNSEKKIISIERTIKILTDECDMDNDEATNTVCWLAQNIYPIEWESYLKMNSKSVSCQHFVNDDKRNCIVFDKTEESLFKTSEKGISFNNNIIDNKIWTLEDIDLEMVYCPIGSFMMGSRAPFVKSKGFLGFFIEKDDGELGRSDNEVQQQVIISKPFMIGKYPVTQKQYKSITKVNPSHFKGEKNPVELVTWNDAKNYCECLNSIYYDKLPNDYKFDLPTEAQWEYACRAGTTTSLNSGKDITCEIGFCNNLDEVGWYSGNSRQNTYPVGQKKPNAWGIYDMHGNVFEWCEVCFGKYSCPSCILPTDLDNSRYYAIRGGSNAVNVMFCRSACRIIHYSTAFSADLGFRVALVPMS